MDADHGRILPEDVREGDVLIYMSGRLLVVDHLVPVFGESLDQILLQLESGVIRGDVYAHGSTMADRTQTDEQSRFVAEAAEALNPAA